MKDFNTIKSQENQNYYAIQNFILKTKKKRESFGAKGGSSLLPI